MKHGQPKKHVNAKRILSGNRKNPGTNVWQKLTQEKRKDW